MKYNLRNKIDKTMEESGGFLKIAGLSMIVLFGAFGCNNSEKSRLSFERLIIEKFHPEYSVEQRIKKQSKLLKIDSRVSEMNYQELYPEKITSLTEVNNYRFLE